MTIEQFEKSVEALTPTITNEDGTFKEGHNIFADLINGESQCISGFFSCDWYEDGMIIATNPLAGPTAAFHVSSVVRVRAK